MAELAASASAVSAAADGGAPSSASALAVIDAAERGDEEALRALLKAGAPAHAQDATDGRSALMAAAKARQRECCSMLLAGGAPWNAVDRRGRCAGQYAMDGGDQLIVDALLDSGVAAELLLGCVERAKGAADVLRRQAEGEAYLGSAVRYSGDDKLLDDAGDAVMMEWERPLMAAHAQVLCGARGAGRAAGDGGADVMNIGFGMGIVDGLLQAHEPRRHVIVEAHPAVLAKMRAEGWYDKPGVEVVAGKWQDVLPQLTANGAAFDGVFFDTYGEHYEDLRGFHAALPDLVRPDGGVYSFFNGLCPFNLFFHAVACEVARLELARLGFDCQFAQVDVEAQGESLWVDVRRRYWGDRTTYYLPIATRGAAGVGSGSS